MFSLLDDKDLLDGWDDDNTHGHVEDDETQFNVENVKANKIHLFILVTFYNNVVVMEFIQQIHKLLLLI